MRSVAACDMSAVGCIGPVPGKLDSSDREMIAGDGKAAWRGEIVIFL